MDLQLQNKAALVTGATAGIGLAIAQELAREGAAVIITGRAQDKIQRALDTIGNGAKGIVADLSNAADTEPPFARLSRVDILACSSPLVATGSPASTFWTSRLGGLGPRRPSGVWRGSSWSRTR
jgi:NADP-dependent 3-hydroxy acid dehydrogenase YdfG